MNCLQCRREVDAQPAKPRAEIREHLAICETCRAHAKKRLDEDRQWKEALQVTVPDGLEDRILLRNHYQRHPSLIRSIAATAIMSVLGLGIFLASQWATPSLAIDIAEHVIEEPHLWQITRTPDQQQVSARLAQVGGQLQGVLPTVLLEACDVPGGQGSHLVLATNNGRVVMTLMPHHTARAESSHIKDMPTLIRPAAQGSYSLVGQSPEAMQSAEKLLLSHVKWRI